MGGGRRAGAQKGAHYSAPMQSGIRRRPAPAWRAWALTLALCLPATGRLPAAPTPPAADARKTEAQLEAVKSEIERVTREVSATQVERDRLTRDLRSAELSVGKARAGVERRAPPA